MPIKSKNIVRNLFKIISTSLFGTALAFSSISQAITIIPDAPQINAKGYILIDFTSTLGAVIFKYKPINVMDYIKSFLVLLH